MKEEMIEINIVQGVEGKSLYINDHRVAGSKPWGGGKIIQTWKVQKKDLLEDIQEGMK